MTIARTVPSKVRHNVPSNGLPFISLWPPNSALLTDALGSQLRRTHSAAKRER